MQSFKQQFKSILQNKTAKDVIGDNFVLRDIGSNETICHALELFQKYSVSSLPVYNEKNKNYVGSVGLHDVAVVVYILAVSKCFVDLLSESVVGFKEFDNEEFKVFAEQKIDQFINIGERNQWATVKKDTHVMELMRLLSNPAQSELMKEKNVVRLGVEDENGKITGLISQFGLVAYLTKQIKDNNLFDGVKFEHLYPDEKRKIVTVKETDVAYEAFRLMLENKISGAGVVNEKGQLVSSFSSFDIKREEISENMFSEMRLTVKEYLSKSKRNFDVNTYILHKNDTLLDVLVKMNKYHLHRIFSVDDNNVPLNVFSLCDIISILLGCIGI
jgi:CBS domain-containing protein